ncbi:MAG: leucyl aminopeptidase family protein, partial [Silvanigrellaceae bacterium]|nr:leucyl aminopeptidase family protein [Silvanigrellaceae bacterium]
TKIKIYFESEVNAHSHENDFTFVQNLHGFLKPNIVYPLQNNFLSAILFLSPKEIKTLNGGKAENAFIAAFLGAKVAKILVENLMLEEKDSLYLVLSDGILDIIKEFEQDFVLGILQRTVSNKIKKQTLALKSNKKIYLLKHQISDLAVQHGHAMSECMNYTRSLINMPPNVLNPHTYEAFVHEIVDLENKRANHPNLIRIETYDVHRLKQEQCGLICAVGEGAQYSPRIVKLSYVPLDSLKKKLKTVSLVGKGITFDSGGLNIKPSGGMRNMKKDMGGSAAVLGTFLACARLGLPLQIQCYLAIAENMISSQAMRPGDVYQARNGLFVEIDNTDAEGRLVLADALTLAAEQEPDWLIDVATLTGAARVALGPNIDALYGTRQEYTELLVKSSCETGDWFWPMPLHEEYEGFLDSCVANFSNSGNTSHAGSITAALFLRHFVGNSAWNHIDSYLWTDKSYFLWGEQGGPTAKCVRALVKAMKAFSGQA